MQECILLHASWWIDATVVLAIPSRAICNPVGWFLSPRVFLPTSIPAPPRLHGRRQDLVHPPPSTPRSYPFHRRFSHLHRHVRGPVLAGTCFFVHVTLAWSLFWTCSSSQAPKHRLPPRNLAGTFDWNGLSRPGRATPSHWSVQQGESRCPDRPYLRRTCGSGAPYNRCESGGRRNGATVTPPRMAGSRRFESLGMTSVVARTVFWRSVTTSDEHLQRAQFFRCKCRRAPARCT